MKEDKLCEVDKSTCVENGLNKIRQITLEYKRKAVDYWEKYFCKKKDSKKRSFNCVKNRFKLLRRKSDLYRWKNELRSEGSTKEKLSSISKQTLNEFRQARLNHRIVHDMSLRRWALTIGRKHKYPNFKASKFWLSKFKRDNNIVSRKINRFITENFFSQHEENFIAAAEFVREVRDLLILHKPCEVFNTDQSGFNLEIHAGRTLHEKGAKKVDAVVQCKRSMTHSYTIQPLVSAEGKLMSPLLVVLQEQNGKFGPRVQSSLFKAENIYALASKSGKLSSDLFQKWLKNVYFPCSGKTSVLLLDSWNGASEKLIKESLPENSSVIVKTIPKGCTNLVQPLDVLGFRIWKSFVRRFSDIVLMHNLDINLHLRNNILKLQSLTHNQLSSPRWTNLFRNSWYQCGYTNEKLESVGSPVHFCFDNATEIYCHCRGTGLFMCCWCKEVLCVDHFYTKLHYCETFVE